MNKFKWHKFDKLYEMSSGISSTPIQAGHGAPFVSFSSVFNNYFLPDNLDSFMDTSELEQELCSVREGDLFLTRTSETIHELAMSSVAVKDYPKATFSGFVKRLRPLQSDITYHKYLGFYLRSRFFRKTITNNAIMTLRASLNDEIFSYLNLYLPEYDVQTRIGDLLYSLYSKIKLNKRINAELEAMARTLYNYWFVQFDFPDQHGEPYKSNGGKMRWNDELKREIPDAYGWTVKRLANITKTSNEAINPSNEPDKEYKHYSIPNFDETGTYKIEKGEQIKSNKFLVRETDVLVSKLNPWFNRVIFSTNEKDLICSTEFVVWRTKNPALKNFLFMTARDSSFISYCTKSATGTSNSHRRVNPTVMMQYQIAHNDKIAEHFGSNLESIIKMYAKNDIENRRLADLRDWLLPMLMNGQVTVNE